MEYRPYTTRCDCACHHYSGVRNEPSVDVADPLHAALACDTCRDQHCPALLDVQPETRPCAEMTVWDDPPLSEQGDGSE